MGIYNTHKEAVIANGSVKGVFTDGKRFYTDGTDLKYCNIKPCNPADYLETLADFLAGGKRLVDGDYFVTAGNNVVSVGQNSVSAILVNKPDRTQDNHIYVLQAAAYDTETPEEKEAFDAIPNQTTIDAMNDKPCSEVYDDANDALSACINGDGDLIEHDTPEGQEEFEAMTDTTPNQVESLSGSEKPNISDWDGEGLPPVGVEFDFSLNGEYWERRIMLFNDGITCLMANSEYPTNRWHYKCEDPDIMLRKPETPTEREDRERLGAAYDLYCEFTRINAPASTPKTFERWKSMLSVEAWLAVADKKADYRKD